MIKKIIYLSLILIIILGIGTTCFGAVGFTTTDELEEFFACYDYNIEFDDLTYPSTTSKTSLNQKLSRADYKLVIFENKNKNFYDRSEEDTQYLNNAELVCFWVYNKNYQSVFGANPSGYGSGYDYTATFFYGNSAFMIDIDNNSYYSADLYLKNHEWEFGKHVDIPAEVSTIEWQRKELIDSGLIYSEVILQGSNFNDFSTHNIFENQGGQITNNTIDGTSYQGTLKYNPKTEVCSITYTKGFTDGVTYDLFLEQYKLDNELEYGIGYYPVDTIDLFDVDKTATTVGVTPARFMDSMHYAYRICLGKNTFNETGTNEVYLCTDWLVPTNYTVPYYKSFSTFHYMDLLNIIEYDPDMPEPIPPEEDPDLGEEVVPLVYISGGTVLDGYISDEKAVTVNVKRKNSSVIMEDFFFLLDIYDAETEEIIETIPIETSGDINIWGEPIDENGVEFSIIISDIYNFDRTRACYYSLRLHSYDFGYMEHTQAFYFNNKLFAGPVGDFFSSLLETIGKALKTIFIPSNGFFSSYFSELNDWFSERLGLLYFPFDFIVDFFSRIYTSEFKDPTIVIPAMQIPLFEEYGNIYDGTTFNFKEFINQHETFIYIYNLYLIAVDGIVIFGLIRLLMKKYEEVTTNGN